MRSKTLTTLTTLLAMTLLVCAAAPAALPDEEFAIPVIELRGQPADIGQQHGEDLAEPIRELHEQYLNQFFQNEAQRLVAMSAARAFERHLRPEHREEIHALAEATGIDPRMAMLAQSFLDLTGMAACSTVALPADAAPDGVARFGRNLDFPSLDVADAHTVVMIVHPEDRYAYAAVTWPGLVGVLSGMNEHGLTLANMEVDRPRRLPQAMPYMLLYRTILEQCRTVDEAVELLQRTPRQTANNLMVMDAAGDRAVIEITPESVVVRAADPDAPLISTNHQRDQDADTPGRCRRYDALHRASHGQFGRIEVESIQEMLRQAGQGEQTLQSIIFEPADRVIHLAAGAEAYDLPYHRLDLRPYFDRRP